MRDPYRIVVTSDGALHFLPLLRIRLGSPTGVTTMSFEALVDSGAADCILPAEVAHAIGIHDITTGRRSAREGIGGIQQVWTHRVVLYVHEHAMQLDAAFIDALPVTGLLGRKGFFENFKITFDPTGDTPGMELERVHKA